MIAAIIALMAFGACYYCYQLGELKGYKKGLHDQDKR